MQISVKEAARLLHRQDNILILTHAKPDGDTLGSAFALFWALEGTGKRARVENPDGLPEKYKFIYGDYIPCEFEPEFVVTVDIANPELLGGLREKWEDKIGLCVDHHNLNTINAAHMLVFPDIPAAALLTLDLIREMGVKITPQMATAIFTGLSTDTGCFRFYNVTGGLHRAAADMIDAGAKHGLVNMLMFDLLSRERAALETMVRSTIEYHFGGLCAIITISRETMELCGANETDLDGISNFPRKIEGVLAGITLWEKDGGYRVSMRTRKEIDASEICRAFGGGGHKAAGGCTIPGALPEARDKLLAAIENHLRGANIKWQG
jgi:phosphoesterase RecJ-like protein